jgi:hypothetical protein
MALGGELFSLIVSLVQEVSIVAGVGALTVTLVGHLLSLHAHQSEGTRGYVRAARHIRALALIGIIVSGGAAVLIHFASGTPAVLVVPAFLFKWVLIALLTAFYFAEWRATGVAQDAIEGFEGANWYALIIVHTVAPVVGWLFLLKLYAGWLITFGVLWAVFVWLMRGQSTLKPAAQKPAPAAAPIQKPVPPPAAKPVAAPLPKPPVPAPKPAASLARKPIEVHPNHSMLPMVAKLDLPAPDKAPLPPAPMPMQPPPAPKPAAPPLAPPPVPEAKKEAPMPALDADAGSLPALHVMPRRPEDIGSSKRGPVVKMGEE